MPVKDISRRVVRQRVRWVCTTSDFEQLKSLLDADLLGPTVAPTARCVTRPTPALLQIPTAAAESVCMIRFHAQAKVATSTLDAKRFRGALGDSTHFCFVGAQSHCLLRRAPVLDEVLREVRSCLLSLAPTSFLSIWSSALPILNLLVLHSRCALPPKPFSLSSILERNSQQALFPTATLSFSPPNYLIPLLHSSSLASWFVLSRTCTSHGTCPMDHRARNAPACARGGGGATTHQTAHDNWQEDQSPDAPGNDTNGKKHRQATIAPPGGKSPFGKFGEACFQTKN